MAEKSTEFGVGQVFLALTFIVSSGIAIWDATLDWNNMYVGGILQIFFWLMFVIAIGCLSALVAWFNRARKAAKPETLPTETMAALADQSNADELSPVAESESTQASVTEVSYDQRGKFEKAAVAIVLTLGLLILGILGFLFTYSSNQYLAMWVTASSWSGVIAAWYIPFRRFALYQTEDDFNAAIKSQTRRLFVWIGVYVVTGILASLYLGDDHWLVSNLSLAVAGSILLASAHKFSVLQRVKSEGADALLAK